MKINFEDLLFVDIVQKPFPMEKQDGVEINSLLKFGHLSSFLSFQMLTANNCSL